MGEVHGLAVHDDEVDLGVGDPGRLDEVLDRLVGPDASPHRPASQPRRQEVVELRVHPHIDMTAHYHDRRTTTTGGAWRRPWCTGSGHRMVAPASTISDR